MYVTHLSLRDFRNYERLDLKLEPGVTLLYGPNAAGKTTVLEAIYFLATTRSPR
ncbi:MAG: DNA replication and repair protein RecF, partial [Roseiflexus castenholzii]